MDRVGRLSVAQGGAPPQRFWDVALTAHHVPKSQRLLKRTAAAAVITDRSTHLGPRTVATTARGRGSTADRRQSCRGGPDRSRVAHPTDDRTLQAPMAAQLSGQLELPLREGLLLQLLWAPKTPRAWREVFGVFLPAAVLSAETTASDLVEEFHRIGAEVRELFCQPGALDRIYPHPFQDVTGGELVGWRLNDDALHTWDLARAIGADETLPAESVASTWSVVEPLSVSGGFASNGFFGTGSSGRIDDSAALQARLLDAAGRRP